MKHDNICKDAMLGSERPERMNSRMVAVYTILFVLKNMRERLGIEAMVGFLDRYTATVERLNPDIRETVNHELLERALNDLYQSVCSHEE